MHTVVWLRTGIYIGTPNFTILIVLISCFFFLLFELYDIQSPVYKCTCTIADSIVSQCKFLLIV